MRIPLFIPACALTLAIAAYAPPAGAALSPGTTAPGFTAPWYDSSGPTGEQITFPADAAGKVVYLQFVTPKKAASLALMKLAQEGIYPLFSGRDDMILLTVIAAFGPDYSVNEALTLMNTSGFTYEALLDRDGSIFTAYNVERDTQVYIIDPDSLVVFAPTHSDEIDAIVEEINTLLEEIGTGLSVTTNQALYHAGDLVQIVVHVQEAVTQPFDGYCGIRLPDMSYRSITRAGGLEEGITPLVTNVPSLSAPASYTLFQATVPPGTAAGSYLIRAVLTSPGTATIIKEANTIAEVQ